MEIEIVTKARQIIASNRYLTLATCRLETPWVAPVAYVVDNDYNFYFYSAIDSIHIEHIKHNPRVALAIFDSTADSDSADGVQIAGLAGEVEREVLPSVAELYWRQSFPDEGIRARWMRPLEDFHYPAIQRFFQIKPTEVYKLDLTIVKIDRRVQIPLKDLIRAPAHP